MKKRKTKKGTPIAAKILFRELLDSIALTVPHNQLTKVQMNSFEISGIIIRGSNKGSKISIRIHFRDLNESFGLK